MNKTDTKASLEQAPLGKKSDYINHYTPSLLFPLPRKIKRDELGLPDLLPFSGVDVWNGYELSWLNLKGKPQVAVAEFEIPCESPNIIESKSFKLYLNSFNNSKFSDFETVREILKTDLTHATGATVEVRLMTLAEAPCQMGALAGTCVDDLDIECTEYMPNPQYLKTTSAIVDGSDIIHTHLLKSNCLVTGQPDWGSVQVEYRGSKIDYEGFLKYIVSLRDHNEFHEQCVERIFTDIKKFCRPKELTVFARYTRRGGLDINPYRTDKKHAEKISNLRLIRQ
jgi:7-cyano-7-deazaguanine reductase